MAGLRYTILADGASDRLLDYPIRWALRTMKVQVDSGNLADLRHLSPKPQRLAERVHAALVLYPAELLFVHRDAENRPHEERVREIRAATEEAAKHHVAVVPVRMTEAWFLHDQAAIRRAAANPHGLVDLDLPKPSRVETLADPKQTSRMRS